ncbi:MAG TPA: hypothetical protein VK986_24015 [Tepidisphaeraceae bacterium]|nr:hypothetical protein [Tepidisphaeraceae bacterium]
MNPTAHADTAADTPTEYLRNDRDRAAFARPVPLGEELPIFCERCGYSLNGCPQSVCDHCAIRHFACPECGHHQPINTLRPAAQRVLGRLRSFGLACAMIFRINFFGWCLVAWAVVGYSEAYDYAGFGRAMVTAEIDRDVYVAAFVFAVPFGLIGRLQVLRWPQGYVVGLTLGALTALALVGGAYYRMWDRSKDVAMPAPIGADFLSLIMLATVTVAVAATIAWPVWVALVQLMLPRKAAAALLEWQRSESDRALTDLARDPAVR